MQLRTLLALAATIALVMVSTTEATTEAVPMNDMSLEQTLRGHSPQPEKTKPMGRALGGHSPQPEKTKPMGRALGGHSPQPEKTKPMGRTLSNHSPQQTIPAGRYLRGRIA